MEQAVITGKRDIDSGEFETMMTELGGHKNGDNKFSFLIDGLKFIVFFDNESLSENEEETTQMLDATLGGKPRSCIIFECETGTTVEAMREFLVQTAHKVQGVIEIDDMGIVTLQDVEENRF